MTYEEFRDRWATMTVRQIEKEVASMRAYTNKHGKAYAWHGAGMTPPGHLGDGDKISALKEALKLARKSALLRSLTKLQSDMKKSALLLREHGADGHASELSGASEIVETWIADIEQEDCGE